MNKAKPSILRAGEDASGMELWKCRFRDPSARTWFVVRGTKSEVDAAASRLQAEGKEINVSRL